MPKKTVSSRGVALALVIVAVAVAGVLAYGFLAAQQTSSQLSRNIQDGNQARLAAAAGLQLAVRYVRSDANWRKARTHGVWQADLPLAGGTVTISGFDGRDTNGDGAIEGDANIADNSADPVTLMAEGACGGATCTLWAVFVPPPQGPAPWGVNCLGGIVLDNQSKIDSFDASLGAYGPGNQGSDAVVSTNATGSGQVGIVGTPAKIWGDVFVGPGGEPHQVISNPEKVSGQTGSLASAFSLPVVVEPTDCGPNLGDKVFGNGTLSGNLHVQNFTLQSGTLTIQGNVKILAEANFTVQTLSRIELAAGATLEIYVKGQFKVWNQSKINVNTADPSRCRIFALGPAGAIIGNNSDVYAILTDLGARTRLENQGQLYGAFIGRELYLQNAAGLHQDVALDGAGGGGGAAREPTIYWRNRVVR